MNSFSETYNLDPGYLFRKAVGAQSRREAALSRGEHSESIKVVRQISQTDLCPGSDAANSAQYEVSGSLHLNPKDMFDTRTSLRPGSIPALLPFRQLAIPATLALYVFPPTFFRKVVQLLLRPVGRVSPYFATGIGFIEQLLKYVAVMDCGISHRVSANKFVLHIYDNMVLVAEKALAVLLRPAGIRIFLTLLVLSPVSGNFTGFDPLVFLTAVALLWYIHDAGIDDLTFPRFETIGPKMVVKFLEQRLNNVRRYQIFPEPPDGRCIRHFAAQMQPEKAAEGMAVKYLKLQRLVREIIKGLQNQHLEHQDGVVWFGSSVGLLCLAPGFLKLGPKHLPVNSGGYPGKRIAVTVNFMQTSFKVEKSGLYHYGCPQLILETLDEQP